MKRLERHSQIKRLIQEKKIRTQEDLKEELESRGFVVTQATLSRDLRDLGLTKRRDEEGHPYYSLSSMTIGTFDASVFQFVKSVARANCMLVIKTDLGEANILANLIDSEQKEDILGTIAGADTLLVICKDDQTAMAYETTLI